MRKDFTNRIEYFDKFVALRIKILVTFVCRMKMFVRLTNELVEKNVSSQEKILVNCDQCQRYE